MEQLNLLRHKKPFYNKEGNYVLYEATKLDLFLGNIRSIPFKVYWFMKWINVNMWYMCKVCCKWCKPINHFFNMDTSTCNKCAYIESKRSK